MDRFSYPQAICAVSGLFVDARHEWPREAFVFVGASDMTRRLHTGKPTPPPGEWLPFVGPLTRDASDTLATLRREITAAMAFLDTWGSQQEAPRAWEGFRWAEESYAPEWVEIPAGLARDQCVTVLATDVGGTEEIPEGWRVLEHWTLGERSCPWCGDGTGEEERRASCELCEGDGLLYWGEEWAGLVLAPTAARLEVELEIEALENSELEEPLDEARAAVEDNRWHDAARALAEWHEKRAAAIRAALAADD